MEAIKIPAIRFVQNKQIMYLAAPTTEKLLGRCEIDYWDPKLKDADFQSLEDVLNKQGYQRVPVTSRTKKIGQFITKHNAVFPGSLILNYRKKNVKFDSIPGFEQLGYLHLDETEKLYIVDGQHRFEGLHYAVQELEVIDLLDFEMPVTIMVSNSKFEEIKQFTVINKTQKKVDTGLGDRLIETMKKFNPTIGSLIGIEQKDWKSRAVRMAEKLNTDPSSPWYQRIIKPNAPQTDFAVASESEFTKSLKPILATSFGEGPAEIMDERVYNYLNEYWHAWKSSVPEAFETPSEHVIQKTPGFHSLNRILPIVIDECKEIYGKKTTREEISKLLRDRIDAERLTPNWWKKGNNEGASQYVGMGPITHLGNELLEQVRTQD